MKAVSSQHWSKEASKLQKHKQLQDLGDLQATVFERRETRMESQVETWAVSMLR